MQRRHIRRLSLSAPAIGLILLAALCSPITSAADGDAGDDRFPCRKGDAWAEFDFWIGTWEVHTPEGKRAGTNRIDRAADGCLLIENWQGARGGSGNSINYRDPQSGRWRQIWVDSGGGVISAEGGIEDGSMRLLGTHILRSGEVRPFRMTWTPLENGHVRQFLEESTDGGKNWSVWFDGDYAPLGGARPATPPDGGSNRPGGH